MADERASDALNIYYGNRSILSTMRGPWIRYGAKHAYMYGESLQVFLSALGLHDIISNPEYGPFPYPVEVALTHLSALSLRQQNWAGLLKEWYGIQTTNTIRPSQADMLIVVDVTDQSDQKYVKRAAELMRSFAAANASILVVSPLDPVFEKMPQGLLNLNVQFTGTQNENLIPFMLAPIDASVVTKKPESIYLFGDSERVISTAIGALDHLVRHRGGKQLFNALSQQVLVDSFSSGIGETVLSFADACRQFGIPTCDQLPAGVNLDNERKKVYISPVA